MTDEEFAELYDRLHRHLFRFAKERLHSVERAQDVVSETFRIAWEKRHIVKSEASSASAYVMGICKNVVLRHLQDRQRHPEDAFDDEWLDSLITPVDDISESIVESHRGHSILRQLSPSDQRLVSLMASPDLEAAEIAEVLGLTKNAYAVRVHRVRRRIEELSRLYDGAIEGGAT